MSFAGAADNYYQLLDRIHCTVVPRTYVEIGVNDGHSLSLALPGTAIVGIDPAPHIEYPVDSEADCFALTSDEFFATQRLADLFDGQPFDLAFIDGMHRFEFALRDFANLERNADVGSTILIHDCNPPTRGTTARDQVPGIWAGDVWKLIVCLRTERPDLDVSVVDVSPTGLGIIRNLDPSSTALFDRYDEIVETYLALDYSVIEGDRASKLGLVPGEWAHVRPLLPDGPMRPEATGLVDRRVRQIERGRAARRALHRLIGARASYALSRTGRRARGLVTARQH